MRHNTLNISASILCGITALLTVNTARGSGQSTDPSAVQENDATLNRTAGSNPTRIDRDQRGRADLDGNGQITVYDLALMLGHWGYCEVRSSDPCPGDINADGVVDEADLAIMLSLIGLDVIPVIEFPNRIP